MNKRIEQEFEHQYNCLGEHNPDIFPGNSCECPCHYGKSIRGLLIMAFGEFVAEEKTRSFEADLSDITLKYEEKLNRFFDSQIKQAAEGIRGMKETERRGATFSEAIKEYNKGLEAAAKIVESLI